MTKISASGACRAPDTPPDAARPHAGRLEAAKFAPKVQDLSEFLRICIWVQRRLAPNVRVLDMGSRVNLLNSRPNRDLGSWCILRGPALPHLGMYGLSSYTYIFNTLLS